MAYNDRFTNNQLSEEPILKRVYDLDYKEKNSVIENYIKMRKIKKIGLRLLKWPKEGSVQI